MNRQPKFPKRLTNERGSSLIEMMIVAGIMAMLATATASLFVNQMKKTKAIYQKLEMNELKMLMMQSLSKSDVCNSHLEDKPIDVTGVTPTVKSPTVVNLSALRYGSGPTASIVASEGQPLPATQSDLEVSRVTLKEIFATGNPNEYRGVVEVAFNPSSLAYAMQPVQTPVVFSVLATDPPAARKIAARGSATAASTGLSNYRVVNTDEAFTVPAGVSRVMIEVIGGGGGGGSSSRDIDGFDSGTPGGGGGYGKDSFDVTGGETLNVEVGDGGAPGSAGGDSRVRRGGTVLISATGGGSGRSPNSVGFAFPPSVGTSTATINVDGGIPNAFANGFGNGRGRGGNAADSLTMTAQPGQPGRVIIWW